MTADLYLSRARLRRNAPIAALRDVLIPDDEETRTTVAHRLVWTLFGDTADRERDFLWRELDDRSLLTLSARPPEDRHQLFDIDPPKPFAPSLNAGDRLGFSLRANATVTRRIEGKPRGIRSDVVMDALYRVPQGHEREEKRASTVQVAGINWLREQSQKSGFRFGDRAERGDVRVMGYRAWRLDHRRTDLTIGVLDFEGTLTVTEPSIFLARMRAGFGRAKAFGCGLMLIRRAR